MNRAAQMAMLTLIMAAGASCATVYAPALAPGQVAEVKLVAPAEPVVDFDGYRPHKKLDVSVHDYANGCPLVEDTRTGKGYRGKIEAPLGATTSVSVPAGRRLTFTTFWRTTDAPTDDPFLVGMPVVLATHCTSVVTFVPERGRTYVIRFPLAADGGKRGCGATVEIEGTPPSDRGPTELVAYPHILRGAEAFQPGGLCSLGAE